MNNAKNLTFESFMQEKFMDLGDLCGIPITKDNCEDLFETWLQHKDLADIMEYAEEYGTTIYKQFNRPEGELTEATRLKTEKD